MGAAAIAHARLAVCPKHATSQRTPCFEAGTTVAPPIRHARVRDAHARLENRLAMAQAEIRLQPVGQMQQVQPAAQDNVQQEKLPAYSERYYDDYFEYRCAPPPARSAGAHRARLRGQTSTRGSRAGTYVSPVIRRSACLVRCAS